LANILFVNLVAHKDQFKKNGINYILSASLGEEQVLKSGSNINLVSVPLHINFESQKHIDTSTAYYSIKVLDASGYEYYEGIDFELSADSTQLTFNEDVSDKTLTASYIRALTLENIEEQLDSSYTLTYFPYSRYYTVEDIRPTISGITIW
jgi:hypothetical protein